MLALDSLYKELNKPTNESNWWSESAENKAHEPQTWTPSVRSVSGSLLPVRSSTCSMWKTEKHETRRHHEVEVIQQSAAVPDTRPMRPGFGSRHETRRHEVEVLQQSAAVPDTRPMRPGFGSNPPAAPVTVLTRNSVANGAAGPLRGSQRYVRRLLRELIASLPLFPSGANQAKITEAPIKNIRHASTARSQSSPPPRRSLSVQTHPCEGFEDQSWRETRPAKHRLSERFRNGDERWAGGVRALRDAHVRLVLRQLRHVERLNRALDRRTIARPPTL